MARDDEGPFPAKLLELFGIRDQIKPIVLDGNPLTSLRGIISELRALSVKLRHDAANGHSRAATELAIVMNQLRLIQTQQTEQMKVATAMEQETEKLMLYPKRETGVLSPAPGCLGHGCRLQRNPGRGRFERGRRAGRICEIETGDSRSQTQIP